MLSASPKKTERENTVGAEQDSYHARRGLVALEMIETKKEKRKKKNEKERMKTVGAEQDSIMHDSG